MLNLLSSGIPLNIDWRQILLHLFNLVILFVVMYFVLYEPVKKFMDKRRKYYEDMDEQSRKTAAEADENKAKYEALVAGADEEIADMKRNAVSAAREESENIIKSAEDEAASVLKKAYAKSDEIRQHAEQQARDDLAGVIAQAAEEHIAKACTVDGFLAEKNNDR